MKSLLASLVTSSVLLLTSVAFAQAVSFPVVQLNEEALGGDVLLIQMKESLVITGSENEALEKELGRKMKSLFTKAMVLSATPTDLLLTYDPSRVRPTVQAVLKRYANVLAKIELTTPMN